MGLLGKAQRYALAAIAAAFALDILVKRLFLARASDWNGRVLVPGLLDTHYAFNHGVSFSLFWQNSSFGDAVLALLLMGLVLALTVAAFRTARPLTAAGYGLIAGGALGNIVDRVQHGAVFDFLVVRLGSVPLFVCNSADILISLGVILLAVDILPVDRSP
ncbi:MAG TPA: signal peptidase II [Rhizomicrobium sp.]